MYATVRVSGFRVPLVPLGIAFFTFVPDLSPALDLATDVFYVVAVLATTAAPGTYVTYAIAALCTMLLLGGAALSPGGAPPIVSQTNCALSLAALWVGAVLVARHKRTAPARAQSEPAFHELAQSLSEVLWVMPANGEGPLYISPAFERTWGRPRETLRADPWAWKGDVHPDDLPAVERAMDRARAGYRTEVAYRIRRPEGSTKWVCDCFTPIRDGSGKVYRLARLTRDVTDRAGSERLSGTRLHKLARANRLDAVGHFATALAHELSHPLGAIANYLRGCRMQLEERGFRGAAVREALEAASEEAARAGAIVKRLRHWIREGDCSRCVVDANVAVEQIARLLEAHVRYNRYLLRLRLAPGPHHVLIDDVQIQQVLVNLVDNAVDAMKDAGIENGVITIATLRGGAGTVDITVTDNGPGIAEDRLHLLFEPFRSTKPDGLGLGLPISRAIVEAHTGTLRAANNGSSGSTFRIQLPLAEKTHEIRATTDSVRC